MENTVLDTILARSSIRAYTGEPLTREQLAALKAAALASPTAMNRQDQRFVFITDSEIIDQIDKAVFAMLIKKEDKAMIERIWQRGGKTLYNAPLLVCIFAKPAHFAGVDAGIAVQDIALAAKSLGLDSCILGMPAMAFAPDNGYDLVSFLGVPDGMEFMIAIAVGHRAMDKAPHEVNEAHIIEVK